MISLAALRYRDALETDGGPIRAIEVGQLPLRGRKVAIANAWLRDGLVTARSQHSIYSNANGTGTDLVPSVARHKAVSEAIERWAFHLTARSERAAEFGFDVDPSTNGMSAFPGLRRRSARRSAVLEAVERFSLIAWWEGLAPGYEIQTDWPGVAAVAVDGPFGGVAVIAYAKTEWGGYVYGHAAEESIGLATERAVAELARHEWILRATWLASVAGEKITPRHIFERRLMYFAGEEGYQTFLARVKATARSRTPRPEILCDAHIPGPWDEYATVWRFALCPLSDGYIRGGEDYFFL
jgi:ribosomal protein S12 methylthiotransferase accessory factor YcaO